MHMNVQRIDSVSMVYSNAMMTNNQSNKYYYG